MHESSIELICKDWYREQSTACLGDEKKSINTWYAQLNPFLYIIPPLDCRCNMRRVLTISTGAVIRVLSIPATVLELHKVHDTISITLISSDSGI